MSYYFRIKLYLVNCTTFWFFVSVSVKGGPQNDPILRVFAKLKLVF